MQKEKKKVGQPKKGSNPQNSTICLYDEDRQMVKELLKIRNLKRAELIRLLIKMDYQKLKGIK